MKKQQTVDTEVIGNRAVEPFSIRKFAKEHGWKIGLGILVGGGLLYAGKKIGSKGKMPIPKGRLCLIKDTDKVVNSPMGGDIVKNTGYIDLDIPEGFASAHIDELWKEDDDILGIMHDVDFADLGKFGKELKTKVPELADMDFVHFPCIGFTKFNRD